VSDPYDRPAPSRVASNKHNATTTICGPIIDTRKMTIAINHGVRINKPRIIATIATAIIIPPIVILGLRINRSPYGASSTSVQSPHLEDRRGNRQSIQMTEIPLEAIN
jgi:hypothetical protein